MLGFSLYLVVTGLVVSFIARGLVADDDPMAVGSSSVVGIAGSFMGGLVGHALSHHDAQDSVMRPSGILGSILGATVALIVYRTITGHSRGRVV
ncbi:MAG: GlsB/YeaQ/YmgE family stress response membrane protein [Ilumatobacteraceae bacterium]